MVDNKDILIDSRGWKVSGAAPHEYLAVWLVRASAFALRPVHDMGLSIVARLIGKLLPSRKFFRFRLSSDGEMRTSYCDNYWSVLTVPDYPYEPSVAEFLKHFRHIPFGFIDGGANYGYWSIVVTGKGGGNKKAVAVEAAADTYAILDENRQINHDRFTAMNKALGPVSGERVQIYGAKHEARSSVAPETDEKPLFECETISLQDLADDEVFAGIDKYVVKLDVEGMEIETMEGASAFLDKDVVVVYEEHGSDKTHETTEHVLTKQGMRVFWFGPDNPCEITQLEQLAPIKKSSRHGYELAATRSQFWLDQFSERLSAAHRAA